MLSQFVFVLRIANKREAVCPYALREVSVLTELLLGHLRYRVTDVPPQPNSPPEKVFDPDRRWEKGKKKKKEKEKEKKKKPQTTKAKERVGAAKIIFLSPTNSTKNLRKKKNPPT